VKQPHSASQEALATSGITEREAFRLLQSRSRLTVAQAEEYLREVRAERLTDGWRSGQ
jgi:hypothetical protein